MITFIQGDYFATNAQVITNTVNCVGVMGKGIALEFKRRFPALFYDYQGRCERGEVRIGKPYIWESDDKQILNFPTKNHWRAQSKIEYIEEGLQFLKSHYAQLGIHSIAMPPLGCGNGGLEWSVVKELMIKHFEEIPDLEVYVYEPSAAAIKARNFEGESDDLFARAAHKERSAADRGLES